VGDGEIDPAYFAGAEHMAVPGDEIIDKLLRELAALGLGRSPPEPNPETLRGAVRDWLAGLEATPEPDFDAEVRELENRGRIW